MINYSAVLRIPKFLTLQCPQVTIHTNEDIHIHLITSTEPQHHVET